MVKFMIKSIGKFIFFHKIKKLVKFEMILISRDNPSATYVGFYKFGTPAILVRNLDLLKTVLVDQFNSFHENDVHLEKELDPLLTLNPFFISGDEWKKYRGQLSPLFTPAKVNIHKINYYIFKDTITRNKKK